MDPVPRLGRQASIAVLASVALYSEPAVAQEVPPPTEDLIPGRAFRRGHPKKLERYHDVKHSETTRTITFQLARARGRSRADAVFLSQVALLHDWDPSRTPGAQARVPSTIDTLRSDFEGKAPLYRGYEGKSVLRERFGWSAAQFDIAVAIIQRTEFPFADKHHNPAYGDSSPLDRYEKMLRDMSPRQRRFVMLEGAILSEFADKGGFYMTEGFLRSSARVRGLAAEINRDAGKKVTSFRELDTAGFLTDLGAPEAFAVDRALARKLRVRGLRFPSRSRVFELLPAKYGRQFGRNLRAFQAVGEALRNGESTPRALGKGLRAQRVRSRFAPETRAESRSVRARRQRAGNTAHRANRSAARRARPDLAFRRRARARRR